MSITGPSGCGKSTLLDILCGLEEPTSGEVFFDGQPVRGRAAWARLRAARIGFVFQAFHLIASLTVAENVELAMLSQSRSARQRRDRVAELPGPAWPGAPHRAIADGACRAANASAWRLPAPCQPARDGRGG
ncbi:MAG: ATP-binding cassette domain-containing protein [Rhodobacter sp.]|nr:ATP-binding cassette domain-containing protein [Rhodobacter sp.]